MAISKYATPETIAGACSLLEEHGRRATILSGGQSLLPEHRQRAAEYDVVVDINGVDGHDYIEQEGEELRIGCLARHTDVANSDVVAETNPTIGDAARSIGDIQVRNRGTFCGAIAQAAPRGDPPTLVSLFDAAVVAVGPDGERVIDGRSFYEGQLETVLEPTEVIREIRFDVLGRTAGAAYEKWTPAEGSYPVAAVGAVVELDDGVVETAEIVTGALEKKPAVMPTAAATLVGEEPTNAQRAQAATTVGKNAVPVADFEGSAEFKSELVTTLTKDALDTAVERAGRTA
jgi:CO/xanthine dehydrogenase FAD-binding subunit